MRSIAFFFRRRRQGKKDTPDNSLSVRYIDRLERHKPSYLTRWCLGVGGGRAAVNAALREDEEESNVDGVDDVETDDGNLIAAEGLLAATTSSEKGFDAAAFDEEDESRRVRARKAARCSRCFSLRNDASIAPSLFGAREGKKKGGAAEEEERVFLPRRSRAPNSL